MIEELIEKLNKFDGEIYSFPQEWSSTALGFGGIGGQAFTIAQTTVFFDWIGSTLIAAIYFGNRFAYKIENPNYTFYEDLRAFRMAPVYERGKYIDQTPNPNDNRANAASKSS